MIRGETDTEQNFNFNIILAVKVTQRETPNKNTIPYFMATEHTMLTCTLKKRIKGSLDTFP